MKTIYYTAATLTGHLATPDHGLDWLLQFPMTEDSYNAFLATVGALAMGGNTYRWLLNHLQPPGASSQPWPYTQPTWVFTRQSLSALPNADIRFASGDPRPVHAAMAHAANGKNLWLLGGGDLVGQFLDHGLLDELIITIAPVTLAAGLPLLPRTIAHPPLTLLSATPVNNTFVELRYQVPRL
jgi:dihydrofolate reductase